MTLRRLLERISQHDDINFLLTNRIPRRLATRFIGWWSRLEQPLVRDLSIGVWKLFADDLALHEAKRQTFTSLHDCFTRELKNGVRPIDPSPDVLVSPCDAIVGACGTLDGVAAIQAKGSSYPLRDLLADPALVERYRDGRFVTLRLTSSMYHRFHAPADCDVDGVTYFSGDTWNVNPVALRRVPRLFCRNERVVIDLHLRGLDERITLVPVAAILVASICLRFLEEPLDLRYRGPHVIACQASFQRGDEMGYFRHGSTILVFATRGLALAPSLREGVRIKMGEPLLTVAAAASAGMAQPDYRCAT